MGQEIATSRFTPADFERFGAHLREETALLTQWFGQGRFADEGQVVGFELEAWLVDQDGGPAAINEYFLGELANPLVVSELARFNVEINGTPYPAGKDCLRRLREELEVTWRGCNECAGRLGAELVMIGVLPTLREEALSVENMSPLQRYHAINEQVLRLRDGRPLCLDIRGKDQIHTCHRDVMLEAATTSLQIHLQVRPQQAVRFFNAAQVLSAPMVAVAANAPYLFGKDLWDDTRIPLFEQSVAVRGFEDASHCTAARVTFGSGYAQRSLSECFQENLDCYPVLLPIDLPGDASRLNHLRLHNGTIWRWNRPLIGFSPEGLAHLRIEHRVVSAGPTVVDCVANIALFLGMIQVLAGQQVAPESQLDFSKTRKNFYAAAKDGLRAYITWLDGDEVLLQALLLEVLLPMARRGLQALDMEEDVRVYLDAVIEPRVRSGYNGAGWQRAFVARHGFDMQALTMAYITHQRSGIPVHAWDI